MIERSTTKKYKESAVDYLELVVQGHIEEAYQKYIDLQGVHHNSFFLSGFPALKQAMIENHAQFPHKKFIVKHVLGEEDLVVVHSNIVLKADEPGMAVIHIFRFSENKIVEMWDIGQAVPADSLNKDGAF